MKQKIKQTIELGDKVKDKYTGFTGIVMAKTEFINGCKQYQVCEKYNKKKASAEMPTIEMSIDGESLEIIDIKLRKINKKQQIEIDETLEALEEETPTGGPTSRGRRNHRIKMRGY